MSKAIQDFIPIEEVRDGIVILRDGQMRMILLASSINFDLKSVDEQEAIISQYQNFLNSLDFSVQFFIQSRKLDIRPYVALLENRLREQLNKLIKIHQFRKKCYRKNKHNVKKFFCGYSICPSKYNWQEGWPLGLSVWKQG